MAAEAMVVGKTVGPALAEALVLDPAGTARPLGNVWATRDAAILFVRQFACAGCSAHVAELRPRLEELAALGVHVVVVGNGSADELARWVAEQRLADHPVTLYTDPSLAAFRAAGLVYSWTGSYGLRAGWNVLRLIGEGHRNGIPRGSRAQQGGTLYVRAGGELAFVHRSQRIGDHAPLVDVVDVALRSAAARGGSALEGLP